MKDTTCKHFNGVQNESCKAGCRYDEFTKEQGKDTLPCLLFGDTSKHQTVASRKAACLKMELPTKEELDVDRKRIVESMERFAKVTPLIGQIKRANKGRNWRGIETCPICQGKLHMSHAAYNGHVHGRCETKDCLAWME
jgi:hypothetical protein